MSVSWHLYDSLPKYWSTSKYSSLFRTNVYAWLYGGRYWRRGTAKYMESWLYTVQISLCMCMILRISNKHKGILPPTFLHRSEWRYIRLHWESRINMAPNIWRIRCINLETARQTGYFRLLFIKTFFGNSASRPAPPLQKRVKRPSLLHLNIIIKFGLSTRSRQAKCTFGSLKGFLRIFRWSHFQRNLSSNIECWVSKSKSTLFE